jgi:hypothetical protein
MLWSLPAAPAAHGIGTPVLALIASLTMTGSGCDMAPWRGSTTERSVALAVVSVHKWFATTSCTCCT